LNRVFRLGAGCSLVLLAACSGADDSSDASELPPNTWQLVETARIGSVDGPDDALTRVGALLPLPNGAAWFVEPTERQVRVIGPDGRLSGRVGGPGQGPGEFTIPGRMGWWSGNYDTIWVADQMSGNVALFSSEGSFGRSLRVPQVERNDEWVLSHPAAVGPDGVGLGIVQYRPGGGAWERFPVLAFAMPDGEVLKEVLSISRTDAVQVQWRGEILASGAHPMSDAPILAFSPVGTMVVVADRDTAPSPDGPLVRLTAVSPQADTLWRRVVSYEPDPVPGEELDVLWDERIEGFQRFVQLEGRLTADEAREAYTTSVPRPHHRPPVSTVKVDAANRTMVIWSAPPGSESEGWLIDSEGGLVAAFSVPTGQEVLGFEGDVIWLLEYDEMEIPFIVRGQLTDS
jgi:hypothetical protein